MEKILFSDRMPTYEESPIWVKAIKDHNGARCNEWVMVKGVYPGWINVDGAENLIGFWSYEDDSIVYADKTGHWCPIEKPTDK